MVEPQPRVIFYDIQINMLLAVLSTVVQPRDLKVRRYEHRQDGMAAYMHVLRVPSIFLILQRDLKRRELG